MSEEQREFPVINLMGKPARREGDSTLAERPSTPAAPPTGRTTMEELLRTYQAAVKARAVFHPLPLHFVKELGRGRQGIVFLALRQGARGCVTEHAVKLLDPQIYRTPDEYWTDMSRIAHQIAGLQRLQSPNLVYMHSYEEHQGIGYVQMEALDGIDLRRLLDRWHLEVTRQRSTAYEWARLTNSLFRVDGRHISLQPGVLVYILRSLLRALERLHAMGFLHSDVKPANVMIDRLGTVKVVDFGRAVKVGERLSFLLGSPLYMAPETHRREAGGPQSDFYSVGLVALEMLRGRPLTDAEEVSEEKLLRLKMELPDRLGDLLPPHVLANEELMAIMRRFVEPDPERRHANAKDAEIGEEGLLVVDRQLVQCGLDTEYDRELADYLSKLVDPGTGRVELPGESHPGST